MNTREPQLTYASRDDFKSALDITDQARADKQIDRALQAATDDIEGLCHRAFFPQTRTMTFDHPDWFAPYRTPWILRLDDNELISVTQVGNDGVDLTADALLRPDDGPPFTRIELDLADAGRFSSGDTHQRAITVIGDFGYRADSAVVAVLAAGITASVTTVQVDDGSGLGVGDLFTVDDERMVITDKRFVDSTQDLTANASAAGTTAITVSGASTFNEGEVVQVNAEKMLITSISGDDLVVLRGWDGSTIEAHTSGDDVLVQRSLTVLRGATGTTALSHSGGADVAKHLVPPAVKDLCVAQAMLSVFGQRSGMARKAGMDTALVDRMRDQVYRRYGRKYRTRAV